MLRFFVLLPVVVRGFHAPACSAAAAARSAPLTPRYAAASASASASDAEHRLLELLSGSEGRGKALTPAQSSEVHRLATQLEEGFDAADTNDSPLLPGRWRVLYQGKPGGETTDFCSVESWKKYLSGDGPSPIQNLVSGSGSISRLYQIVQLAADRSSGRILNVVDASPAAVVAIEAKLEDDGATPNRLGFRFSGGSVLLRTLWGATLQLPYPVPFELLGDNAKGWLQTDYLTPSLRLSRGNKGSLFVLAPEPEPDDPELEALLEPPPPPPPRTDPSSLPREPVLICPAQFGTTADYQELIGALEARGHPVAVAPLQFTDWLQILKSTVTPAYWKGELSPDDALPFYYEAIERGAEALRAEYPDRKVHVHGAWYVHVHVHVHGACAGACAWRMCMVHGACAWCMCMVHVHVRVHSA